MKYWLYLIAKLAVAIAFFRGLWLVLEVALPKPPMFRGFYQYNRFGQDLPWTTAIFVYLLMIAGVIALIFWDQRYRCRACLRRLRMPVEHGEWDKIFRMGAPRVEYICPFGHGTLNVPELKFNGGEKDDWRAHEDLWKELEGIGEPRK
jgi:hypothetical protein